PPGHPAAEPLPRSPGPASAWPPRTPSGRPEGTRRSTPRGGRLAPQSAQRGWPASTPPSGPRPGRGRPDGRPGSRWPKLGWSDATPPAPSRGPRRSARTAAGKRRPVEPGPLLRRVAVGGAERLDVDFVRSAHDHVNVLVDDLDPAIAQVASRRKIALVDDRIA